METPNNTAYRVFKILQWLYEEPLTLAALNHRFCAEGMAAKPLSADSIGLYMNTLKALGCEITRPTRKNGFCFSLLYHPFGIPLDAQDIETLCQVKKIAEERLSGKEILVLHRFFKKVLRLASGSEREQWIHQVFTHGRGVDYEFQLTGMVELTEYAEQETVLHLTYESPVKGKEAFDFLPDTWVHQEGRFYLQGYQSDRRDVVLLRLDRIVNYEPATLGPEAYQALLAKKQRRDSQVIFKLLGATEVDVTSCDWGETASLRALENGVEVTLYTKDFFLLKQKLLACGFPFTIVVPNAFRLDMEETLTHMQELYADAPR